MSMPCGRGSTTSGSPPVAPVVEADVAQVKAFRETLRPLVLAVLDGRTPDVAPLQAWLDADEPLTGRRPGRAARGRTAVDDSRPRWRGWPARPSNSCRTPRCGPAPTTSAGMAYLDPGGRRRWCAPETCGVKARVRAHRARARVSPPAPA